MGRSVCLLVNFFMVVGLPGITCVCDCLSNDFVDGLVFCWVLFVFSLGVLFNLSISSV